MYFISGVGDQPLMLTLPKGCRRHTHRKLSQKHRKIHVIHVNMRLKEKVTKKSPTTSTELLGLTPGTQHLNDRNL